MSTTQFEIHQGIVVLVELTPSIHSSQSLLKGATQFKQILVEVFELMNKQVITLPNTGVGLYLFNSAETSPGFPDGIYEVFRLQDLNVGPIKLLNDLIEDSNKGYFSLAEKFAPSDKTSASAAQLIPLLNKVYDEFSNRQDGTRNYNQKKIFLFTDNDEPLKDAAKYRLPLRKKLSDLNASFVSVCPFFLDSESKKFNVDQYAEVFFVDLEGNAPEDGPSVTSTDPKRISSKISRLREVKRLYCQFQLEMAGEIKVSVKAYSTFSQEHPKRSCTMKNEGEAYLEAETKTKVLNASSGSEIPYSRLVKAFSLGGELIPLTDSQVKKLQKFNPMPDVPFLKVLGFRDLTTFSPHYSTSSPLLIVPDYRTRKFTHSVRTFATLYQACVKKNKLAIVWGALKRSSSVSVFAMVPTPIGRVGFTNSCEGFFLIRLPFKNDIRQYPVMLQGSYVSEDADKLVEKIVNNLYLSKGYDPSSFQNPTLNWHYKMLKDDFLQTEVSETVQYGEMDRTKKAILKVRDYLSDQLIKSEEDPSSQSELINSLQGLNSELNRMRNFEYQEIEPKKSKTTPTERKLSDEDLLVAWKSDTLNKFKVAELKKYVSSRKNLISDSATRKQDIIDNITSYLTERFG